MTLPSPGSPNFFPALLEHARAELGDPDVRSIHPGVFSTLLLDRIVGGGGVIIDVEAASGSIGETSSGVAVSLARVGEHIKSIAENVFGTPCRVIHLSPSTRASDLGYLLQPTIDPRWPHKSRRRYTQHEQHVLSTQTNRNKPLTPGSRLAYEYGASASTSRSPRPSRLGSGANSFAPTPVGPTPKNSIPLLRGVFGEPAIGNGTPMVDSPDEVNEGQGEGVSSATPTAGIPPVVVLCGLERCSSAVWVKLVEVLGQGRVELALDEVYRDIDEGEGDGRVVVHLPEGFTVVWVREEDQQDAPGWLVDRFACNTIVHPDDVSPRPLPLGVTKAIIPPSYLLNLSTLLPYMHIHPPLYIHLSNILSAISNHPRLHASLTARGVRLFPDLIRAHRLLAGDFDLPRGWEWGLQARRAALNGEEPIEMEKEKENGAGRGMGVGGGGGGGGPNRALGGGKGGVMMWDVFAGAEPSVRELGRCDQGRGGKGGGQGEGGGDGGGSGVVDGIGEEGGEEVDEPYATPTNLEGVYWTAMRHRVGYRSAREEVMWLLKGTAGGLLLGDHSKIVDSKTQVKTSGYAGHTHTITRREARRRGREVDKVMKDILDTV